MEQISGPVRKQHKDRGRFFNPHQSRNLHHRNPHTKSQIYEHSLYTDAFVPLPFWLPTILPAVGVLGGSVSSCHGLDATTAHPLGNPIGPNCYPHRVFAWLNDVFPHPANELTNGACEFKLSSTFSYPVSSFSLFDGYQRILAQRASRGKEMMRQV